MKTADWREHKMCYFNRNLGSLLSSYTLNSIKKLGNYLNFYISRLTCKFVKAKLWFLFFRDNIHNLWLGQGMNLNFHLCLVKFSGYGLPPSCWCSASVSIPGLSGRNERQPANPNYRGWLIHWGGDLSSDRGHSLQKGSITVQAWISPMYLS